MKIIKILFILFFMGLPFQKMKAQDAWVISTKNPSASEYYGITAANGVIGIVSSPEPLKIKEVVLAGVYDMFGRGRVSNFLPSFNLLNMQLMIGEEKIDARNISNMEQSLDMRYGMFHASFDYKDELRVEYTYCALRHLPYSVLLDMKLTAKKNINLTCSNMMETPSSLRDGQQYYNEIDRPHALLQLLTSVAKSPTGNVTMAASNSFIFNEPHGSQPKVVHEMQDNNMHLAKFKRNMKAGESYTFSVVGSVISSVQYADPLNQAERLTIYAKLEGKDRLVNGHKKAWDKLWESDIEIEGDPQAQQDVRSMLYHMYAFNRENTDYSPSPMGLSGLGYNGHVFWDTELWMYPAMLLLHPEMARSMVEYRYNRLEAAKKNAFTYGYKGAMYPWESADTGVEETPVWALTGPFEHHITACVAIATWNYYLVTGDKQWLKEKGWPILQSTAEFWCSRVEKNGKGEYEIKNVVAADEWAENVDNNAFTNAAAKVNLEYATKCARLLGMAPPAEWTEIASNIPIRQLANGVTSEHDTYKGEPIKQADVNLLAFPLKVITDKNQIKKDLEYYEVRIPEKETPAMTQAVFSLLYSRLGDAKKSYHFFKDAYEPNLLPPFRVIAETKGGTNPYFITGAGGVLQTVLMGYGGLDIQSGGGITQIETTMPAHWKSLTIKGIGIDKKTYIISVPLKLGH
ncbi:Kojibiose phosphorylase [uncultured Dysgonomonas sp.]|uniref:Kojibiose phosphorylase n=1 Tax=uncultured Dysgonomonas sp. TaxID=206096 RepID=A0A212J2M3_9BACT|nr:glycoside hydrolase family 65 protein [uncultured Dysgonomonas sp.]SBV93723.1 Kojibiose phosphorylase [uncultured Dysgonomonas sp.]